MLMLATVGLLGGGGVGFTASQALVSSWIYFDFTGYGGDAYFMSGVTVNVVGGTGPFTYAWTQSAGDAGISDPTAYSTGLLSYSGNPATFYCTVTDANGAVAVSNECTIS